MKPLELITTRRSVRRFKAEAPARALVEELVAAAVHAPSASNKQPWRFFATDSRVRIERLAAAVEAAVARIAAQVLPALAASFREYGDYFVRFRAAPVVLVVAWKELQVLSNLVGPGLGTEDREAILEMESASGLASAGMAIQNLLLYAHARGLAASPMTGPMVARAEVRGIMGIPGGWRIAAVVPVGIPDETPVPTARKPVEAVLRWMD